MTKTPRPAIVVFPGSNCERDMEYVLKKTFHLDPLLLWHKETRLADFITHIILPGGFSFGDYLRAGALATTSPIMKAIKDWAHSGLPLLGICNGFQILCEAKLLPGVLLKNHHDRFICSVESMTWNSLRDGIPRSIRLPIAHREGRYYADNKIISELTEKNQIVLTYNAKNDDGDAKVNGAKCAIAGIVGGVKNNILGMMPHPERMVFENLLGADGRLILHDFLFGYPQ